MKSHPMIAGIFISLFAAVLAGSARADGPDQEPIPGFYQEPGVNPNRDYVNHSANERIDPFTGKLQWSFTDFEIPGNGGFNLRVQRSYSSRNEDFGDPSPVGVGWTMHFGRVLRKAIMSICDFNNIDPTKAPVLELQDGSRSILYIAAGGGGLMTTGRWRADCTPGHLQVFSPDGVRYDMDTPGPLVGSDPNRTQASYYPSRITDRNGNFMTITYTFIDALNFGPLQVNTSDGRQVNFEYEAGVLKSMNDGSRVWTYIVEPIPGFIGGYYLKQATRPDGASWQYEYNGPGAGPGQGTPGGFSMKKVTYPTGGQISYTYGFVTFNPAAYFPAATVVTQKIAGSDAWNYAYVPATNPLPVCDNTLCPIHPVLDADKLDKTTVSAPDGNDYVYQHIGYTSATSGYVFLIGSLLFKQTGQAQFEGYSWGGQLISYQTNLRPGGTFVFDGQTNTPVMFQKSVNRGGATFTTQFYDASAPGFGFDGFGNPGRVTEIGPSETGSTQTRVTTLTYFIDTAKWIIHQKKDETTDTIGTITRTFDPKGNLLSVVRYGVPTAYTYTAEGDVDNRTDARSNTVSYSNYFRGVPQTESHPEGVTITREVSPAGNVLSETDGESSATNYSYDGLNRITSITHAIGNPVTVVWSPTSRTATRGPLQEVTTFDSFGRRVSVTQTGGADGPVTQTFAYDPIGRRVFVSYPNSLRGTHYQYSAADHLLTMRHATLANGSDPQSGQGYFHAGHTLTVTNERGFETKYTFRGWGDPYRMELMKIEPPEAAATVTMTRNGLGQITQVTQDNHLRTNGYDARYFLTTTTDPEVGTTTFGRDAVGNMTSRQVGAAPATSFDYDGRNRLRTVNSPIGTPNVNRTYFLDDKLASVDNGLVRREFIYDRNKNVKQEKVITHGQTFVTGYSYDGNDALDVITYGSGKTVTYAPDALGRPTRAMPYLTGAKYHPAGEMKQLEYANGVKTDINLNVRQWPQQQVIAKSGVPIFDTSYGYEGNGNVFAIVDNVESSYFRQMFYDGIDRLTNVSGPWGAGTFTYDGRGNIRSQVLGSTFSMGYNYDEATDRLTSTVGSRAQTFQYDAYGNITSNGSTTFGYDDASMMRCARCGQPDEITYEYDGLGLRTRSQQSGAATYFVHDANGRLMWEKAPDGAVKEYVYLSGHQVATRRQAP